jgi:non-ribosomal peptide synthetase component E (peptide arylation enzyme)
VSVIGLPDDYYGETICACIIAQNGQALDVDDLQRFLGSRLAAYKIPTTVITVEAFPLNAMGKVIKADLTRIVLERLAGD